MTLNQKQKDLVVGTLLGDGNLQTETRGVRWRYRALHKQEHQAYLQHKYEILRNYCGSGPFENNEESASGKTYYKKSFNTLQSPDFAELGNKFYVYDQNSNKFVKVVPNDIESLLTPEAVAYWYMDDGARKDAGKSKAARICTECFTEEEVRLLQQALQSRYNIITTLAPKYKKQGSNRIVVGNRLYIPAGSAQAFMDLIREFVVPCMQYKLTC